MSRLIKHVSTAAVLAVVAVAPALLAGCRQPIPPPAPTTPPPPAAQP